MSDEVVNIDDDESVRIQRFLYGLAIGTVAFVLLIVIAILTADQWLKVISPESERRFIEPYMSWVSEHLLRDADPALQDYVEDLGMRLAQHMDLEDDLHLEFRVIRGETINAFTTLGGYIFVFDGLIEELDDENSLAMVLAHEIAHARNRDPLLGTGRLMLIQIMISSLTGSGGFDPTATDVGTELMLNMYSREQEQAADLQALAVLQQVYGHVGGATSLFRMLEDSTDIPETMDILSSHPDLGQRIDALESEADEKGWSVAPTSPYPPEIEELLR